jgi:hypothetical protein
MKRILIYSLILGLAVWGNSCTKQQIDDYASIAFSIGEVKKNGQPVNIGDILNQNDIIETGTMSSCDIKIGDSMIRIKENSKAILAQLLRKDGLENTTLGLDVGKMICKPKKLLKNESFLVKTPTAVAGVRGTNFSVEADAQKTTRIKVFDGKVAVVKRVEAVEEHIDKIIEAAPAVEEKEKVVITADDVKKAEKKIEEVMKKEGEATPQAVEKVVAIAKEEVVVKKDEVQKFKPEDFKEEKQEIIKIEEKPKEVVKEVTKIVKKTRQIPQPEGQLLVTRYEIYFVKNGRVEWEGKVINPPTKTEDKIYIASGDYIFCAKTDGTVLWRKKLANDGKVELEGEKVAVYAKGQKKLLDRLTGEEE